MKKAFTSAGVRGPTTVWPVVGEIKGLGRLLTEPASPLLERLANTLSVGSRLLDRKSTRLNSSHLGISYAVFCLKKKVTHNGPLALPFSVVPQHARVDSRATS